MRSRMGIERVELDEVGFSEVRVPLLVESTRGDEYGHGRKSD